MVFIGFPFAKSHFSKARLGPGIETHTKNILNKNININVA